MEFSVISSICHIASAIMSNPGGNFLIKELSTSYIMKVMVKRLDFLFLKMSCIRLLCCLLLYLFFFFFLSKCVTQEEVMEEEMQTG